MTCDEKDARINAPMIVEFMTSFFEMISVWLNLLPEYCQYYQYMQKNPYLYMVCPEAAILNLAKSFITSLEIIFGSSPRSEEFFRTSSAVLAKSANLPQPKSKKLPIVQLYFIDAFINTGCLMGLKNILQRMEEDAPIDFTTVLSLLN